MEHLRAFLRRIVIAEALYKDDSVFLKTNPSISGCKPVIALTLDDRK
jgi:hypothetical protein